MIKFNDCQVEFFVASGALGFDGNGYWFEQPARWVGLLQPQEFVIITKTLTYGPRVGQLKWWCPWRSVRFIENGVVNAVSLTNPGYRWWVEKLYDKVSKNYRVIPSIMPFDKHEAKCMIRDFNKLNCIIGIEYDASCPNIRPNHTVEFICEIANLILKDSRHPLIVKLSYQDDYLKICRELDKKVTAFDLINSVPYRSVFPEGYSPLIKYGFMGSVSGPCIKKFAREALQVVKDYKIETPIISGGGIDSLDEVLIRKKMGAEGIAFGTIFMKRPWLPNQIVKKLHN
jgi:dihydroorotate dehydrogenase